MRYYFCLIYYNKQCYKTSVIFAQKNFNFHLSPALESMEMYMQILQHEMAQINLLVKNVLL